MFSAGKCDHKIMGTFLGDDHGDGSIIQRIILIMGQWILLVTQLDFLDGRVTNQIWINLGSQLDTTGIYLDFAGNLTKLSLMLHQAIEVYSTEVFMVHLMKFSESSIGMIGSVVINDRFAQMAPCVCATNLITRDCCG